jgi:hypothetical protein
MFHSKKQNIMYDGIILVLLMSADIYRITAVLKVETDIITSIAESLDRTSWMP